MSKLRRESAWQRRRRLKIPKGHCTWCRKPVKSPSRHWCAGEECLAAFKLINDVAVIRQAIEDRDHGICALCGNDPAEANRLWYWFRAMASEFHDRAKMPWRDRGYVLSIAICRCLWCEAGRLAAKLRDWQADHILPVSEGGGQCGLENYQSLCRLCHARQTAALAVRRAQARRASRAAKNKILRTVDECKPTF